MDANNKHELKQGLSNRHIQLIALGGAIGTGLFLGLSQTIKLAGPSILLGYAIAGIIAFLIMRHLGEMVVEEPVSGSFSYFANKYWGKNGWFYVWLELLGFVCTGEYGRTECDWYFYSVLVARNSDMADRSIFLYFN